MRKDSPVAERFLTTCVVLTFAAGAEGVPFLPVVSSCEEVTDWYTTCPTAAQTKFPAFASSLEVGFGVQNPPTGVTCKL